MKGDEEPWRHTVGRCKRETVVVWSSRTMRKKLSVGVRWSGEKQGVVLVGGVAGS